MTATDHLLHWEDFRLGDTVDFGRTEVTGADIAAFAGEFDPDPGHLTGPAQTASDWHVCAMLMRMMCDDYLLRAAGAGAPGIEHVRWHADVRPGDVLTVRRTALETRASKSRPRIGIVRMLLDVYNQNGELVLSWLPVQLYDRRDPGIAPPPPEVLTAPVRADPPGRAPGPRPSRPAGGIVGGFEHLSPGVASDLGTVTFTTAAMLGFATRFNPQYFHADEAAAAASLYGGLIASGWHNAAVWNRLCVLHRQNVAASLPAGQRPAATGPSIAVLDMKWPSPVRPGDSVTYRTSIARLADDPAELGWGVVESHDTGTNQRGETVLALRHLYWVERDVAAG